MITRTNKTLRKWLVAVVVLMLLTFFYVLHTRDPCLEKTERMQNNKLSLPCFTSTKFNTSLPDFAMYLRMYSGKKALYESLLVQSMKYFWTLDVPLVVVLDDTRKDKIFGKEIKQKYPHPEVCHEGKIPKKYYHNNGHSLQQLSMFHVDRCFNKKYVGFIDTDTTFITIVTPQQLFDDGKPIIIGQFGKEDSEWWYKVSVWTEIALGKKEVFRCMSQFPAIFKVEHIIELRKYMEKLHKADFNTVFQKISKDNFYSQFSIMCNYVWYFHRDEYKFHAQLRVNTGVWTGEGNNPGRQNISYYNKHVSNDMRKPIPRTSLHYRYHQNFENPDTFKSVMKEALCHSGGFYWCPETCKSFNSSSVHKNMFLFEYSDWTWDKRCMEAQRQHYATVCKMMTPKIKENIIKGCQDVNNMTIKLK